jgi:hypothetical protein
VSNFHHKLLSLTADPGQYPTNPIVTVNEHALVKNEKGRTSVRRIEQLIEDEVDVLILQRVGDCYEYVGTCRNFHSNYISTLAKDKEGHIVDDCSATAHKMNEECRRDMNVAGNKRTLCFTLTCSKTDAVDTQQTQQGLDTRQIMTDDRMITAEQLCGKVSEKLVTTKARGFV